ncbi:hypothetical protein ACFWDI_28185 [Streptomyces sp. NPDC060064]|uniref:hypothetical protein n=1 Tax=Streptomyces sp. NPDC060064 TaxID=3347049 RepID=UPI0036B16806
MTRKTASTINDEELDQLYERLEFTEAALARIRDGLEVQVVRLTKRAEQAEATVARVTDAVMNQSYLVSLDEALLTALDGPAQRPAAATGSSAATPGTRTGDAPSRASSGP